MFNFIFSSLITCAITSQLLVLSFVLCLSLNVQYLCDVTTVPILLIAWLLEIL